MDTLGRTYNPYPAGFSAIMVAWECISYNNARSVADPASIAQRMKLNPDQFTSASAISEIID